MPEVMNDSPMMVEVIILFLNVGIHKLTKKHALSFQKRLNCINIDDFWSQQTYQTMKTSDMQQSDKIFTDLNLQPYIMTWRC